MKQLCFYILMLLLSATSAMAQKADNTHVSVRCGDTPLESLLTDGQKQAVTHLTVTGVLLDEDYKYLREKLFTRLDTLDMRDADIDTIPNGALNNCYWEPCPQQIKIVYLPKSLVHLSDNALSVSIHHNVTFYMFGKYPTLGANVYSVEGKIGDYNILIEPTPDNTFFKNKGGYLISNDDKILYRCQPSYEYYDVNFETIKIIYANAFESTLGYTEVCNAGFEVVPCNVDSIGDRAFAHLQFVVPCDLWHPTPAFYCRAAFPPKLGKDVFLCGNSDWPYDIVVPDESVDLYKSAPGWCELNIYGEENYEKYGGGIDSPSNRYFKLTVNKTDWQINSELQMRKIIAYSSDGRMILQHNVNSKEAVIKKDANLKTAFILTVLFDNGKKQSVKLTN